MSDHNGSIREEYSVGPYKIVIREGDGCEPHYTVRPDTEPGLEPAIEEVRRRLEEHAPSNPGVPKLQQLIESRLSLARRLLSEEGRLDGEGLKVAQLATFRSLRLDGIFPLLLDDEVEEIFLDHPREELYVDHRRWGRCRTNLSLSEDEISAIKTRLCSESGFALDPSTPSLKTEVLTEFFHARFSVDVPPLAYGGLHMDIRKLRLRHFTLPELIANGTITTEACAYLYYCLVRRQNICVVGEPDAGKTTLINALDILTPPHWRKLTIEDVVESIEQTGMGFHQARFKVAPMESTASASRSKSGEVVRLLHRAPDFIYLGEIQTAEHSRAMFHALSCGLKGLETCHALSAEQAIRRWVLHHGVPLACMYDLDIIVCMRRLRPYGRQERRVVRICEVEGAPGGEGLTAEDGRVALYDSFAWDPRQRRLTRAGDLFDSPVLRKIRGLEAVTPSSLREELSAYASIFELLAVKEVFSVNKNVDVFRMINEERVKQGRGSGSWADILARVRQMI